MLDNFLGGVRRKKNDVRDFQKEEENFMNVDDCNQMFEENAQKESEPATEVQTEDKNGNAKYRSSQIVSILTEKAKQTDGKLTWSKLDSILQSLGVENDTDEIDEILSICEREGIEITDEDTPLLEDIDGIDEIMSICEGESIEFIEKDNPLEDMDTSFDEFYDNIGIEFRYTHINSGIRIDNYIGWTEKVTIPAQIDDLPVTAIGDFAFSQCESLTEIRIPEGVTSIGYSAFYNCTSLKEITILASITTIGDFTFIG